MKQTHHIGYVQTPSVKNLSNVKNALVENGLVPLTTPNEMLPDAIEKGLKALEFKDYGMIYEGKYRIRYFDIDGTILKIEYVAEGGKLTPPTKTPNYDPDYLIFDEWNYDIENYVVEQPTDVGAIYKTVDDATYLFIRPLHGTSLKPDLAISGFTSIDWGDGTVNTSRSHTYTEGGSYIIKIKGEITFSTTSGSTLLGGSGWPTRTLEKAYLGKVKSNGLSDYLFYYCYRLKIISLPKNITKFPKYAIPSTKIVHINIPYVTTISSYSFQNAYGLRSISSYLLTGGSYTFSYCQSLIELIIGGSRVDEYTFISSGIRDLWLKKTVTSLYYRTFESTTGLTNVFIPCEKVLNLYSDSFGSNSSQVIYGTIFWVNDDFFEEYKTDSDWTNFVSQVRPLSWYPSLTDPNAE